ncbi:hypothetical protein [Streptomyces hebeiensis]
MDMTIRVYRVASDGTRTETVPEYRVDGTAEPNRKLGYLRTCACPMHKGGYINPPVTHYAFVPRSSAIHVWDD